MIPTLENPENKDVFQAFNVQGKKNWEDKPLTCPLCNDTHIGAVELLGVRVGPFFWECERCTSRFLRYPYRETKKLLLDAEDLWYDLEKLDTIWLEPPN